MGERQPAGAARTTRRHLRVVDEATTRAVEEAAHERVREFALTLLTARARTRVELETACARKGFDSAVVGEVLDGLAGVGLVDDAAYARAYAEQEAGRRGPRAVAAALQRRGIDASLARHVTLQTEPHDVRAAALAVAQAALPRLRALDRCVAERRLAGMLARRGFSSDVVFASVREVLGDHPTDVEPLD